MRTINAAGVVRLRHEKCAGRVNTEARVWFSPAFLRRSQMTSQTASIPCRPSPLASPQSTAATNSSSEATCRGGRELDGIWTFLGAEETRTGPLGTAGLFGNRLARESGGICPVRVSGEAVCPRVMRTQNTTNTRPRRPRSIAGFIRPTGRFKHAGRDRQSAAALGRRPNPRRTRLLLSSKPRIRQCVLGESRPRRLIHPGDFAWASRLPPRYILHRWLGMHRNGSTSADFKLNPP